MNVLHLQVDPKLTPILVAIPLAVIMLAFGYVAGNARSFNLWKLLLLALIVVPIIAQLHDSKTYFIIVISAFVVGFLLPYAHILQGLSDAIIDLINSVRYRSAYEDIKRKQEEIEELRRKYEQAENQANKAKQEYEQARRQEQSREHRENQKSQQEDKTSYGENGSQDNRKSQSGAQQNKSSGDSVKARYLKTLGLEPNKEYSKYEIKTAYRRAAMKTHPDRHCGKSEEVIKEMNERFKEVGEAYEELLKYV